LGDSPDRQHCGKGGFFEAETPRGLVVSIDEHSGPSGDPAAQFAKSITTLAAAGVADPASVADDRTIASALARLLGNMSAQYAEIVASLLDLSTG
jgi:hypothetical protein